jgi:tetratricopeptide (TPR) repeat protein
LISPRVSLLLAALAGALFLWAPVSHSQNDRVVETFNRGQAFYKVGKYDKAPPLMQKALKLSEKNYEPEHTNTTLILNHLGLLTRKLDDFAQADKYLRRTLAICRRTLDPNHYQIAVSLNNLALLYQDNAKFEEALEIYQRTIPVMQKAKAPNHAEMGLLIGNVANM